MSNRYTKIGTMVIVTITEKTTGMDTTIASSLALVTRTTTPPMITATIANTAMVMGINTTTTIVMSQPQNQPIRTVDMVNMADMAGMVTDTAANPVALVLGVPGQTLTWTRFGQL